MKRLLLATALMLASLSPNFVAFAQTTPPPAPASIALSESTIKGLQEALNKQGIAVTADGVLSDETRAAIRKYQTEHHLAVTGEADQPTLDKLGIVDRQSATPQAPVQPGQMQPGQMQAMMQMMQGMMQMMQGQMQPGQMQPGQMQPGQMQPGQMQPGQMQGMMQMMQGMMQMMQMMQGQMQPGQMQ